MQRNLSHKCGAIAFVEYLSALCGVDFEIPEDLRFNW